MTKNISQRKKSKEPKKKEQKTKWGEKKNVKQGESSPNVKQLETRKDQKSIWATIKQRVRPQIGGLKGIEQPTRKRTEKGKKSSKSQANLKNSVHEGVKKTGIGDTATNKGKNQPAPSPKLE